MIFVKKKLNSINLEIQIGWERELREYRSQMNDQKLSINEAKENFYESTSKRLVTQQKMKIARRLDELFQKTSQEGKAYWRKNLKGMDLFRR